MKKIISLSILLTTFLIGYSQPIIHAKKNPRSFTEGVVLMNSGMIDKDFIPCKLVEVRKTMRGYKHIFYSDTSGILIRFYNVPLMTDTCYKVKIK